jgi:hypothetical protein
VKRSREETGARWDAVGLPTGAVRASYNLQREKYQCWEKGSFPRLTPYVLVQALKV